MSFLARVRSWFDVSRAIYGYQLEMPSPVNPDADNEALINAYAGWVYVCASKNACRVASQPLKLYATTQQGQPGLKCPHRQLSGREAAAVRKTLRPALKKAAIDEVLDHPALDLLDYVNEIQGRYELFELTELGLELTGNAYWWITKDSLGVPREILILPPHLVKVKLDGSKLVGSYVLGEPPDQKVIPADQVIHFRFPNPDGSVYGTAPAKAAWGTILDYRAMQLYERGLNNNLGVPSLFIKYQGVVEKAELARIEADWNRKLKGINKSGRVMVGDSKFDVTPVGLSPRDMSFREGRKWARTEIAGCFGVPIDLLDTEDSNRATSQTANLTYEQFTILPRLTRIADKLNERLIPFYDDRLFFQYEPNVTEDATAKADETTKLVTAGILTVNEARERYNLPPIAEPPPAPPPAKPGATDEE
jgi:HK97 family phage portal protein